MILTGKVFVIGKPKSVVSKNGKEYFKVNISTDNGEYVSQIDVPQEVYNKVPCGKETVLRFNVFSGRDKEGKYFTSCRCVGIGE